MTQKMEKYTMLLDWKNQYCENDYTTKFYVQIQCDPYQIINAIFHRTRTKKFHNSYGNTKGSIRKFLELISEFSKVAGYKINTHKSLTNNEKSEREIKESIPFTIATKRINYLGIKVMTNLDSILKSRDITLPTKVRLV